MDGNKIYERFTFDGFEIFPFCERLLINKKVKLIDCTLEIFLNGAEIFTEFSDFNKFRESDKSLKYDLGSI